MRTEDDRALVARALALTALMMVTSVAALPGEANELTVPAGTVWQVDGPLAATTITVAGTVQKTTPGDLVLEADTIRILDGAVLRGPDGAPGDDLLALTAVATDGGHGGSLVLHARRIEVARNATLQAGSGGAGGDAIGWIGAFAGAGGHGGDVVLDGLDLAVEGRLLPGAGGDGGHAVAGDQGVLPGLAMAGPGGDAGTVRVGGAAWPAGEGPAPASSRSTPVTVEAVCALVGQGLGGGLQADLPDCGLDGLTVMKEIQAARDRLCAQRAVEVCDTTALVEAVKEVLAPCVPDNTAGATLLADPSYPCGIEDPGVMGLVRSGIVLVQGLVSDCGIRDATQWSAPLPSLTAYSCQELVGYAVSDVVGILTHPPLPGMPGLPMEKSGCMQPQGEPGEPNALGDGGDGGDACVDNSGSDGTDGTDGADGVFFCSNGGNGGSGASAAASEAVGGSGGLGTFNGGAGGGATALSNGGSGGDGGDGGHAILGPDCAGGNGGSGGSAADATAVGGTGGAGLCGRGGDGGEADAQTDAGEGGHGGHGSPAGLAGVGGAPGSSKGKGGDGGLGASICPNPIIKV